MHIATYFQQEYLNGFVLKDSILKGRTLKTVERIDLLAKPFVCWNDLSDERKKIYGSPPITSQEAPRRSHLTTHTKLQGIHAIHEFLDVESSSRYQINNSITYCHTYVCDFIDLAGGYLPRVWWTKDAIKKLRDGENLELSDPNNVDVLGARGLYNWLYHWGSHYEWRQTFDADKAQLAANNGQLSLIAARRESDDAAGHICMIIPENNKRKAIRKNGRVIIPAMSHAGIRNRSFFTNKWWIAETFRFFGFWISP